MTINTGDAPPSSQAPYHASPAGRRIIEDTIAELLAEDVIEESESPWASPAILVRQKGKDRFCIDYRKVNEVTTSDQYPIPRIDDILSQFAGNTYFTTFDANKGFHQIEIDPKDRPKTAFRTHKGLHQYKRMPFGLKSGPAVFQCLMDKVLGRFKWQIALVYIDDIIIYSKNFDSHVKDIETILTQVGKSGITLSPKKCHVGYQQLSALGHTVSNLGIGTAEGTVEAVRKFPEPRNVKELQRFLGLCAYYRRFVEKFSIIAHPLYNLLKKDVKYEWSEACQKAFDELKLKLTTAPVLAHPNYDKEFILQTDASILGVGGVLGQKDDDGLEHPIAYISRSLTPAEVNYTITELECLAIIWCVRKLHCYLDGSKFLLQTDHSALQWLFDFNGSNRRLIRWSLELQPYRGFMVIKYREGKKHANVDPLSRAPLARCNVVTVVSSPPDFIVAITTDYTSDPHFSQILESCKSDIPRPEYDRFILRDDGILLFQQPGNDFSRVCVPNVTIPENLQLCIIRDQHDVVTSGHLGNAKTTNSVCRYFHWPNMTKDIKDYVRSCLSCQLNKPGNKSYGPHQPLPTPPGRWHTITMDFAGPFVRSGEGQWDMVMVVVDKFTKRTHYIPTKQTDTAEDTA